MKRIAIASVLAVVVALLTTRADAEPSDGRLIEGAWTAAWTFTASSVPFVPVGSGFSALHAFHRGGTVTSVDDDFFDSTGVGAWTETGERRFRFGIHFFLADDQSPSHSAPLVGDVVATVKFDPSQDRWSGTFRSTLRDRSGTVIGEFAGTVVAERLAL
jgi:hypothetical protein